MAEINRDKVTLPGIIYLDIKEYLKVKKEEKAEKKAAKQRAKAENRKIKFREVFVENCKKGYYSILSRYYAHKEKKILQGNSQLEDIQAKKVEAQANYRDQAELVQVMQEIREEQKAAKKAEQAVDEVTQEPVQEVEPEKEELGQRLVDSLSNAAQQKAVEEEVQANLAEEVQATMAEEIPAEEVQEQVNEPLAIEGPVYGQEEVQPVEVVPVVEEETPVVEAQPVEVAPVAEEEQQLSGTEDVNAILREVEGLGKSVAQVQQTVVKSLATKQRELDTVTKERDAVIVENQNLVQERDAAIAENEKNTRVYNSVLVSKDQDIESLRAQLEQERAARIQAETQFNNYVRAIQALQMPGQAVAQVESAEVVAEEGYQKGLNRI